MIDGARLNPGPRSVILYHGTQSPELIAAVLEGRGIFLGEKPADFVGRYGDVRLTPAHENSVYATPSKALAVSYAELERGEPGVLFTLRLRPFAVVHVDEDAIGEAIGYAYGMDTRYWGREEFAESVQEDEALMERIRKDTQAAPTAYKKKILAQVVGDDTDYDNDGDAEWWVEQVKTEELGTFLGEWFSTNPSMEQVVDMAKNVDWLSETTLQKLVDLGASVAVDAADFTVVKAEVLS